MDSLPARFISLPARFISMGVWVTGVRDAWEDFDVVVNNGNYSRTSLFRSRERIIGLFTAHSKVLSVQLVSCIYL